MNCELSERTVDVEACNILPTVDLGSTFVHQKYVSEKFVKRNDINHREVSEVLKQIRIKNVNKVIIGHLNVNCFAVKLDAIKIIIQDNVDIMIFSETKLDASYPMAQLMMEGFRNPFRLDRNSFGGGLLIYVRSNIPCKLVHKHLFSDNIEGIFIEINLRKSKWLLFGTYHPPSQNDNFYFNNIGRALDVYTQQYDKILLVGDFNAEEKEVILNNFMELYDLKNLVKENTCFKSFKNPTCVDLFLTNCSRSFQHTNVISTGISDCHKMIITVLKTTFNKAKPKEITYRCYKDFNNDVFAEHLRRKLENCENYTQFENRFLEVLNEHAPIKKRLVRANEVPYMTKALRKAIANRSRMENRFHKYKTVDSLKAYKKQKNYCSRLYKKERRRYYTNLDVKNIMDNKKFWRAIKPFLSDKGVGRTDITLIEGDKIIQDDSEVANTLNDFFSNAVASLKINIPSECITEDVTDTGDVIEKIILKYSNHPSIKLINNNVSKGYFSFNEVHVSEVKKLLEEIDGKKATMSSSIPPKVLKESIGICCEPLTYIINKGIVDTCFDSGLKIADLTPIYKADETTNKRNYRNISLLPAVSKIFENIMQGQISVYMEKYLSPFFVWLS